MQSRLKHLEEEHMLHISVLLGWNHLENSNFRCQKLLCDGLQIMEFIFFLEKVVPSVFILHDCTFKCYLLVWNVLVISAVEISAFSLI